jgi:hypothetical protein
MMYYVRVLGVFILGAVAGCGDSAGSPAAPAMPTFERLQTQVFNVSCSSDSCHGSVGRAADLVLEEGQSWESLVNHPVSNPVAAARGWMRVNPGQPDTSFLMAKLADNLAAGEGKSMPYGVAPLDAKTLEILRAWIAAGAPASGVVPGDDGHQMGGSGETSTPVDLPPPHRGVQLHVTSPPVPRGKEETGCHYFKLPSDVAFDVNRFQIAVSGGSHHIHLYRAADSTLDLPDGYEVCNQAVDFDKWELVVATQLRHSDWELPTGVGYHFRAGEQLLMQTHFVNVGSLETVGDGQAVMNLNAADPGSVSAYAGTIFGQNKDVDVLPHSMPTAAAECVFPAAITLMAETGHYHFRGRHFQTFRWDDEQQGQRIYDYVGYDDPPFSVHAPALSFAAEQGLQWECTWENTTDNEYTFGPFTDTNEHCNWFGFYYPTGSQNEAITCVKLNGVSTTTVRAQH